MSREVQLQFYKIRKIYSAAGILIVKARIPRLIDIETLENNCWET
jgi:hypothetical protein